MRSCGKLAHTVAVAAASLVLAGCVTAPERPPYRTADDLEDGFYVRTFPDGSGSVAMGPDVLDDDWSIDCRVDAMNDKRKCSFDARKGHVFVYYGFSASPQSVCISGHDFPGRRGQIRVGANPPVTTDTEGCVSAGTILGQLKTGQQVSTRSYRWPYDYPVDQTFSLQGFNKTMEVVERIRSGTI